MIGHLILALAALAAFAQADVGIWFRNNHTSPMHISMDWAKKDEITYGPQIWHNEWIQPGGVLFLSAPAGSSPKYYVGPVQNSRDTPSAQTRNHNTIVEATYAGYRDVTFFDIDVENGFSVPLWCKKFGDDWANGEGCLGDLLAACPQADRHYDQATGIYDYCIGRQTAESIAVRASLCPNVYVQSDDPATKSMLPHSHGESAFCSDPLLSFFWLLSVRLTFDSH